MKAADKVFDLLQYAKGSKLTPGERMYADNLPKAPSSYSLKLSWNTWEGVEGWRSEPCAVDKEGTHTLPNVRYVFSSRRKKKRRKERGNERRRRWEGGGMGHVSIPNVRYAFFSSDLPKTCQFL